MKCCICGEKATGRVLCDYHIDGEGRTRHQEMVLPFCRNHLRSIAHDINQAAASRKIRYESAPIDNTGKH